MPPTDLGPILEKHLDHKFLKFLESSPVLLGCPSLPLTKHGPGQQQKRVAQLVKPLYKPTVFTQM